MGHALGLGDDVVSLPQEIPTRGSFAVLPPADPTIYRLYEVLQVYGPALKALIHEDFGDGIMSAITFNLALERRETDAGPALPWTASSLSTNGRADARAQPARVVGWNWGHVSDVATACGACGGALPRQR